MNGDFLFLIKKEWDGQKIGNFSGDFFPKLWWYLADVWWFLAKYFWQHWKLMRVYFVISPTVLCYEGQITPKKNRHSRSKGCFDLSWLIIRQPWILATKKNHYIGFLCRFFTRYIHMDGCTVVWIARKLSLRFWYL